MLKKFVGTGVALVTPFDNNGEVDYKSLENIINHCISGGVDYLVSLGTTGESVVLTEEEKQAILTFTVTTVNQRVPVVAGFGGNNTQHIINNLTSFDLRGIDAILSSSPNYNKPTQEGIYEHYKAISENSPLPIILYNVPSRTSMNMAASTTIRLANDFSNIIAIKEASCDMAQCMEIAKHTKEDFLLISGDDLHALPMISFGCSGVISVVAQAIPQQYTKVISAALNGDFKTASTTLHECSDLIHSIYVENNPAGIKAALHHIELTDNNLRLPLVKCSDKLEQVIQKEMSKVIG